MSIVKFKNNNPYPKSKSKQANAQLKAGGDIHL